MPYLDHSCWPTHFNSKRLIVETILNSDSSIVPTSAALIAPSATDKTNATIKKDKYEPSIESRRRRNLNRINNVSLDESTSVSSSNASKGANEQKSLIEKLTDNEEEHDQNYVESESIKDDEDCAEEIVSDDLENSEACLNLEQHANDKKIENEIEQLRKENNLMQLQNAKKSFTNPLIITKHSSSCSSFISSHNTTISNQDLVASSLKATDHFNKKIEDLENYSNIIENATNAIDNCFNDIRNVYTGLSEKNSHHEEESSCFKSIDHVSIENDKKMPKDGEQNKTQPPIKESESDSNSESDFYNSNLNQNDENNTTTSEILTNDSNLSQFDAENNYLFSGSNERKNEIKHEIK